MCTYAYICMYACMHVCIVTSVPSPHQRCPGDKGETPAPPHHGGIGHTWGSFARGQISRVRLQDGETHLQKKLRTNAIYSSWFQSPASDRSCPATSTAPTHRTGEEITPRRAPPHLSHAQQASPTLCSNKSTLRGIYLELSLLRDSSTLPHWWRMRADWGSSPTSDLHRLSHDLLFSSVSFAERAVLLPKGWKNCFAN